MISHNSVTVMGYVGAAPELRFTNGGDGVLSFRVAQTARWKEEGGAERERTTWFGCSIFGKRAEALVKFLRKGEPVFVTGEIRTHEYEKDGVKRTAWEVRVNELQLLAPKPKGDEQPATPKGTDYPSEADFGDDEIPF